MNDKQSESRLTSTEAFQESLDVLGDLLDPLEEDEELPIPNRTDSQPDRVWDEVGDDLEAMLHSESSENPRLGKGKKIRQKS